MQFLVMPPLTKLKSSSGLDIFLPQADLSPYLFKITFLSEDFNPVFEWTFLLWNLFMYLKNLFWKHGHEKWMQYFDSCSSSAVYEPKNICQFLSAAVLYTCDRTSPPPAFRGNNIQLLFTLRTVLLLKSTYSSLVHGFPSKYVLYC